MKWLFAVLAMVMILGPLRKTFFGNWRFTVPAVIWGYVAFEITSGMALRGAPWWFVPGIVIFVSLGAGTAGKEWLDDIFGKGE